MDPPPEARPSPTTPVAPEPNEVDETALLTAARHQHPGLKLGAEEFAQHLAAIRARTGADPLQLAAHAGDLYLACACAAGEPAALLRFEALCLPAARAAIGRIDGQPQFVAEVAQDLRGRLLVRDDSGGPPRIARYDGRGPLLSWVRTAAVRLALDRLREQQRSIEHPAEEDALCAAVDDPAPEEGLIRRHYREHFREAFAAALATLSARERTLLKLQLLDGLTEEQIGTLYSAHRVTIARWLGRARRQLLDETQRQLAEMLGLPQGQLESITGLIPSRLDLSLSRLLRAD